MIQQTQRGGNVLLTATEGLIHKIGTDTYVRSIMMLPGESADLYEEVAEKPAYTKEQYDAKVAEFVRERYSESEEFAIQRKAINAAFSPSTFSSESDPVLTEYQEYNAYVEECKMRAKNPDFYGSGE